MGKDGYMTRIGIVILGLALLCSCSSVPGDDGWLQSGSPPDENIGSIQQRIVAMPKCSAGYPFTQVHDQLKVGATYQNRLVIPAEAVNGSAFGAFIPPLDTDHPLAQNWDMLKAPSTSVSSPTAPFAKYNVRFGRTGTYSLWVRARGLSSGQNSIYVPTDFDQNPSTTVDIPDTNTWVWTKARTYTVENIDIIDPDSDDDVLEFRIGHRERNTEVDTLVFVLSDPAEPDKTLDRYAGYVEAENALLPTDGSVSEEESTTASGGWRVGGFKDVGEWLQFSGIPAGRINIRYYVNSDSTYGGVGRQASVYLRGSSTGNLWKDVATAHFPVTGSDSTWDTTFVYLPGDGQVRFQIDPDDYTANQGDFSASFDYISFVDGGFVCMADSENALEAAVDTLSPWNTVVLPISNCETPSVSWYDDLDIVVLKPGFADRPFSLRAETAGEVHLTGDASIKVPGNHVVVDGLAFFGNTKFDTEERALISVEGSYNRLTNTTIIGPDSPDEDDDSSYWWVYVSGHHNRIDHNHFENKAFSGQTLRGDQGDGGSYIVIDHNYFGPRLHASNDNGREAITVGMAMDTPYVGHHVLKYNLFEDATGEDDEAVSIKNSGAYVYYNTFKNNWGHLTLREGDKAHVEGNVFRDSLFNDHHGLGIRVFGVDHKIINNYFDHVDTGLRIPGAVEHSDSSCYDAARRLTVAHNTFAATSPAILFDDHPNGSCPPDDPPDNWKGPTQIVVANNYVGDKQENWPVEPFVIDVHDSPPPNVRWFNNYAAIDAPIPAEDGEWLVSKVNMAITGSDTLLRGTVLASAGTAAIINPALPPGEGFPEYVDSYYDVDGNVRGNPARVGADETAPNGNVVIAPQNRVQLPFKPWDAPGPSWGRLFQDASDECPGPE